MRCKACNQKLTESEMEYSEDRGDFDFHCNTCRIAGFSDEELYSKQFDNDLDLSFTEYEDSDYESMV